VKEERWKPVPGYEGWYEVSDWGNVASLPRATTRGKVLKAQVSTKGYRQVGLSKYGTVKIRRISNLVLEAFVSARPPGHEACHGPGGQLDDSLGNLSWGTPAQNQLDRRRDGTSNQGERSVRSKMTSAIVSECRYRYAAGETQLALAAEFGVSPESMGAAIRGETYANVPGAVSRKSHETRLTDAIVLECRRRYAVGESQAVLCQEFGVTSGAMSSAIKGRTWAHLTESIPADDGRSRQRPEGFSEKMREAGRKGAEKRWHG
jgi:NUMOD4 motif